MAVQQNLDAIRVTFSTENDASSALADNGLHLFGIWCRMDGGPLTTIVHLFDFPFEECEDDVKAFFNAYGTVKNVRLQKYLSKSDIFTGTRLVDIVLNEPPPRIANINGYMCRVWYKGQPLICNLSGTQGHRSSNCPNKDKCRLCGAEGHFARACPNPWGRDEPQASSRPSDASVGETVAPSNGGSQVSGEPNRSSPVGPTPPRNDQLSSAVGDPSQTVVEGSVGNGSASSSGKEPGHFVVEGSTVEGSGSSVSEEPSQILTESVGDGSSTSKESSQIVVVDENSGDGTDIEEFSSPPLSSVSISDFSQESQSILNNIGTSNIVVDELINESDNVNDNSVLSESTSNNDPKNVACNKRINDQDITISGSVNNVGVDSMDTSGESLKRKSRHDPKSAASVSRSRSVSLNRKRKKQGADASVSPVRGRHSGLPAVVSKRPPWV